MHESVPKIVITGGPCGGKTSAMPFLHERLREAGYFPILVPEAPTILMNAGHFPHGGDAELRAFQERVIDLILTQEEEAHRLAEVSGHHRPIIICDRGIMDTKAYTGEEMFVSIASALGFTEEHVRDVRYHAVFHMQSTAIGAGEYYTKANNAVRLEGIEEAQRADERTLAAWRGHPRLAVITNAGRNFEQKLDALWVEMCRHLPETSGFSK